MDWKILLSLFIIFAMVSLLILSPRGQEFKKKYLDAYITKTAEVIQTVPEKINTKKIDPGDKFNLKITTEPAALDGQRFNILEDYVEVELIYDSIDLNENIISSRNTEKLDFRAEKVQGTVFFEENERIRIQGISNMVEVNGIVVASEKDSPIEFEISGVPVSYMIEGISKNNMDFSGIFGLIQLENWAPLSLNGDTLKVDYFEGDMNMQEDKVIIEGSAYKVKLNNVDLSLEKK